VANQNALPLASLCSDSFLFSSNLELNIPSIPPFYKVQGAQSIHLSHWGCRHFLPCPQTDQLSGFVQMALSILVLILQ
jgi:hypothetical protein